MCGAPKCIFFWGKTHGHSGCLVEKLHRLHTLHGTMGYLLNSQRLQRHFQQKKHLTCRSAHRRCFPQPTTLPTCHVLREVLMWLVWWTIACLVILITGVPSGFIHDWLERSPLKSPDSMEVSSWENHRTKWFIFQPCLMKPEGEDW